MNNCRNNCQIGATLPLVALTLTALLGVAALAIDVGTMTLARQRAQNVADAAALAGAANTASVNQASAAAGQVVAANNRTAMTFQGLTAALGTGNAVTVQGYVNAPLSFAPAVGYAPQSREGLANTLSVPATATAAVQNICSLPPNSPVAPFGLIGDDPSNTDPAEAFVSALLSGTKTVTPGVYQPASSQVTLKLNVWDSTGKLVQVGNFDPLQTSGSGASYLNTMYQTSDQTLSVGRSLTTVPLPYDNNVLTQQGVAARLSPTDTAYTHASATYDIWFNGKQEQTEGHLMLLPVISQAVKNKPGSVTIIAFAAFWVDTPYPVNPLSNYIVRGRFIGLTVPGGSGGSCSGAGDVTLPRLMN